MKKIIAVFIALLSISLCFSDAKDFNSLRMYQVMVSTFKNGDDSIGYTTAWGPSEECSGDLQGIIDSLDYIKSLGCNALWMTPVFDSVGANSNDTNGFDGRLDSTGYYAKDFFKIDSNFGTEEIFAKLVEECHKRNIYVILDGVFGHWGDTIEPSPSNLVPQRPEGKFSGCSYPESLDYFKEVATYWIKKYKIDGWRLDQCYQVGPNGDGVKDRHNYWYDLRVAVEEACAENKANGEKWGILGYMVGECWKDTAEEIQNLVVSKGTAKDYGLYSCFDFPSRNNIIKALTENETDIGSLMESVYKTASEKGYDTPDGFYPNLFLTNHDEERLGTLLAKQDCEQTPQGSKKDVYYRKHKLAIAALASFTGPLTIYYGDEWGSYLDPAKLNVFPCYADNSSRTAGKTDGFTKEEQDVISYTSSLMCARNEHEALWNGSNTTLYKDKNCYIGKKSDGKEEIIYILNYSNDEISYKLKKNAKDLLSKNKVKKNVRVAPYSAMFIKVR